MRALASFRLFLSGTSWLVAVLAATMLLVFATTGLTLPRGSGRTFFALGFMVWSQLPLWTWLFERQRSAQLAFMTLVPQPVAGKWLVLAPMCAAALVAAVVMAACGVPLAGACAFLGCGLWAIAVVRWVGRSASWFASLLPVPLVVAAPFAALAIHRAGHARAAGAAAMALGLGALALQPRAYLGPAAAPQGGRGDGTGAPRAAPRHAVSIAGDGRAVWLASAVRLMSLSSGHSGLFFSTWFVLGAILLLACGWAGQVIFALVMFVPTDKLTAAYSRDSHEFLWPRPITRGQRLVSGVVIPVLFALALPALAIPFIDVDWINYGGLGRWWSTHHHDSTLSYLRDALGATFLPEKWPAGGLTPAMWAQLRPLLYLDVVRMGLLMLASLFSRPLVAAGSTRYSGMAASIVFMLINITCAARISFGPIGGLPVPPLWFVALVAGAAVASWNHQRRLATAR